MTDYKEMEIPKPEERAALSVSTPADIAVLRFSSARAQEIASLTNLIENPTTTKLIFQKLPCHMRRRAMSHNPNRMPRALREAHIAQMTKSGNAPAKPKRPRRKYRRRPGRLLEEYKKRSSQTTWLETHIWHAKRFHMTVKFGYHLPERSCARSHRFCHRAVAQHSILLDASYLCCTELRGPQEAILAGLAALCCPKVGLTFASKAFLDGQREGRVLVFPSGGGNPIGLVTYLWRPMDPANDESRRILWVWSHPAFYDQLLEQIRSTCQYLPVEVVINKGQLNRFRLRGPTSHAVVSALLSPQDRNSGLMGPHLPPGYVTGVEVRDPRTTVPQSRSLWVPPSTSEKVFGSSRSQLWEPSIREEVTNLRKTLPDHVINKRRSELLVPGSELPVQPDERPIPILIVNAPADGTVQGCDVILPSGWATAFWLALVYGGGHAGGLADVEWMNYQHGICRDLRLPLDSSAGRLEADQQRALLMEEYFAKPAKTRTNFIKMATPFPFGVDWDRLVTDWSGSEHRNVSVLRDRAVLRSLNESFFAKKISGGRAAAPVPSGFLLAVTVRLARGSPHEFAMICLSGSDDKKVAVREPVHKDPAAKVRKSLRQEHRKDLVRLARKRKEERKEKKPIQSTSGPAVSAYKEKMRSLWLPPPPKDLKTDYARPVLGFVVQGDFALSLGGGMGRGYIASDALPTSSSAWSVLIRNPGTDLYMPATMELDCNPF